MLGLPLLVVFAVVGAGVAGASLGAIWLGLVTFLLAAVLVVVALAVLRLVIGDDPQKLRLLGLRLLMRARARTLRFWKGSSAYAPTTRRLR